MDTLEVRVSKIKNFPQYKNKNPEELRKIAQEQLDQERIIGSLTFCINNEEKEFAKSLLENYLTQSSFENFSERQTLCQLIDQELLARRMKERLKKEYEKDNPAIPLEMADQLDKVIERIEELQEKLGLNNKEQNNALDEWRLMYKKALVYYKENAGCNVTRCPYCKRLYTIMKDMRGYTTEKLTFFKRTILYNKEMYRWYDEKKITREELAEAFGIHPTAIDLIYENIYKNDK